MEAVALALALIIPAAQGYQKCAELLKSYRSYTSDFKKSEEKLLIQKKIFYHECLLLLSTVVDQEATIEMLAHDNHPS